MNANEIKAKAIETYKESGLNKMYSFLKKNGIYFKKEVYEFGLDSNRQHCEDKKNWINVNELQFHYYSLGIKPRKTGYSYDRIRGIRIVLL